MMEYESTQPNQHLPMLEMQSTNGYALIGDPPVCQPDSTWSTPPSCLSKCELFLLVQHFSCACISVMRTKIYGHLKPVTLERSHVMKDINLMVMMLKVAAWAHNLLTGSAER